ncbi:MAG: succinate dehydrogenase [Casimicrobiaceae bacterium]
MQLDMRTDTRHAAQAARWYRQRISAMVLAVCVLVHLVTIVYAVRSGLSADALLARTRGNLAFAAFYGVFVGACAVHVPPGLARIGEEWLGLPVRTADILANLFALVIVVMGVSAIYAVVRG